MRLMIDHDVRQCEKVANTEGRTQGTEGTTEERWVAVLPSKAGRLD